MKRNRDFIPGCSRNTRGWEEEHDRSDVEEVAEENLESVNSSVSYSDETNIWSLSFSCWTVEEVWRQCSRFQENKHPCIKNVEVKSDGVIGRSLKRQRTAIAIKLQRDNTFNLVAAMCTSNPSRTSLKSSGKPLLLTL